MLTQDEKVRCLSSGFFEMLDDEAREAIAERMGERELQDGEVLILEGEPGNQMFVIVSGTVEVRSSDSVLNVLGPGEVLGEMALLGRIPRTATVRARGPVQVLFLRDKALHLLLQQIPELSIMLFRVLVERLKQANELIRFLSEPHEPVGTLEIESGPQGGMEIPLLSAESILGRKMGSIFSDGLRVVLEGDGMETRHARLILSDGTAYIEGLTGTVSVDGEPIEESVQVLPENRILIGEVAFRVRCA
jgi:CRP-like cAMP-binding protein